MRKTPGKSHEIAIEIQGAIGIAVHQHQWRLCTFFCRLLLVPYMDPVYCKWRWVLFVLVCCKWNNVAWNFGVKKLHFIRVFTDLSIPMSVFHQSRFGNPHLL